MADSRERVRIGGRELVVTNLDKVMYPDTGTTKADVLAYYAAVAPVLILERTRFGGHGRGLPVFPDRGECFHGFNAEKFHG